MNRIVTASKQGQTLTLKVAKRNDLERFLLVKEALTLSIEDGSIVATASPVNGTLVISSSGDTLYDDTDSAAPVETESPEYKQTLPVGNPNPDLKPEDKPGEEIAKGGVIFFSTDIDDRNAMWKRRIDTNPETGHQSLVNKFDFSISAIKSAIDGWAQTLYNRFNRKSKQRSALMEFFNKNKVFVGHTVFPRGTGSYINPYQDEPDTRPQYTEEQSYVMMCKGLTSELLTELAEFIRTEFNQAQVLIQDDNTGRTYLYP